MQIRSETAADTADIEVLLNRAFGPLRFQKTAYLIRQGLSPQPHLSIVMDGTADGDRAGGTVLAVLRFWPVLLGATHATGLLLGPLAVTPALRGRGLGAALMREGLRRCAAAGHRRIILIGDPAYYARFGFSVEPVAELTLPAYEPPERFQGLALTPGAFAGLAGPVKPALDRDEAAL